MAFFMNRWVIGGVLSLIIAGLLTFAVQRYRGHILTSERTTVENKNIKAENASIKEQAGAISGVVDHQTNITTKTIETQRIIERNIANGKQDSTAISPVVADVLRQLRDLDDQQANKQVTSTK